MLGNKIKLKLGFPLICKVSLPTLIQSLSLNNLQLCINHKMKQLLEFLWDRMQKMNEFDQNSPGCKFFEGRLKRFILEA